MKRVTIPVFLSFFTKQSVFEIENYFIVDCRRFLCKIFSCWRTYHLAEIIY
jgi:hypothetical protein